MFITNIHRKIFFVVIDDIVEARRSLYSERVFDRLL